MGNCCFPGTSTTSTTDDTHSLDTPSDQSTATSAPPPFPTSRESIPLPLPLPLPRGNPPTITYPEPAPIGRVLGQPMKDVHARYEMGNELGRGQFGVTYLCTDKATGEMLACKTIAKSNLAGRKAMEDVRREVLIMQHLAGQPNIVELKGAYEDRHSVHLVMEFCEGGDLYDRIIAKVHYTERAAAALMRVIVKVVHTCHSMGVMHRDLKPENFLLLNKDEDAPLMATDFGFSVFFREGEVFRDMVGSAYYIAPEVLKEKYGPEVDIWSIGVMLYILLCGFPPFYAKSEHGIYDAVSKGRVDFARDPWPSISPGAKDLVRKMLHKNPKQRLTALQVLDHPWIKEDGEAPNTRLDNTVLDRLKQFKATNKFKKVALRLIAGFLSEEEICGLKEMFKNMDTDNSGTITLQELKMGLVKQETRLPEKEVKQLMEAADVDGNGVIDYEEFITATMQLNRMDREERHLYTAFQHFDKNKSGYISMDELEQALKDFGMYDEKDTKEILSEVDFDKDGRISYDEFVAMMRKGNGEEANPRKRRDVVIRS